MSVQIVKVIENYDHRQIHAMRDESFVQRLAKGQVALFFNHDCRMFSVADAEGGLYRGWYDYDDGGCFDVQEVKRMMRDGVGLVLKELDVVPERKDETVHRLRQAA